MLLTKESLAKAIPSHKSVREIAAAFGVKVGLVYRKVHEYGLSLDELMEQDSEVQNSPTPEQIKEAAAKIRASWTAEDRARRAVGGRRQRWTPPSIKVGELIGISATPRRMM